ncbi:MFS family permease [Embleya sp. AB8]
MLQQFTINTAFYMLMPFLATHLADDLGLAAWSVGLVLGTRNLCQQGLFLVGGALADRLGCKPVMLAGCALRTAGFALLGFGVTLPTLLVAAALTGFAGALFNPAVRAHLAAEAGERRVDAFALFNIAYQAGMLLGPVVGIALLNVDFRLVCTVAAVLFAGLTVAQAYGLRRTVPTRTPGAEGGNWRVVVANRPFLLFSAAMTGAYVLTFQLYLALPLRAGAAAPGHEQALTSALFATSALVAVAGQTRITTWIKSHWTREQALHRGLMLTAGAFTPLLLPAMPTGGGALRLAPLFVTTIVLAIGTVVIYPFEMDTVVSLARNRLVATHYGLYNTICGIGITLGNLAIGALWDTGHPALSWLALTATGLLSALAVAGLSRRGLLRPTPAPTIGIGISQEA